MRIAVLQGIPEGLGATQGWLACCRAGYKYSMQANLVQRHVPGIDGAVGQAKYWRCKKIKISGGIN